MRLGFPSLLFLDMESGSWAGWAASNMTHVILTQRFFDGNLVNCWCFLPDLGIMIISSMKIATSFSLTLKINNWKLTFPFGAIWAYFQGQAVMECICHPMKPFVQKQPQRRIHLKISILPLPIFWDLQNLSLYLLIIWFNCFFFRRVFGISKPLILRSQWFLDILRVLLLMAEILHQLIGSISMYIPLFVGFHTSQVVVWDFSHQKIQRNPWIGIKS